MSHVMNPFDFVPLPQDGPRKLAAPILAEPRYEGYLTYTLTTLTPLHITGRTEKDGDHFKIKHFNESYGKKLIPGSSVRGMMEAYIEAVTGSDLRSITRGDEGKDAGRPEYGKWYEEGDNGKVKAEKCRHVGFLMAAELDPRYMGLNHAKDPAKNWRRAAHATKEFHERRATLPKNFAMNRFDHEERAVNPAVDVAGFLFGYVPQEKVEKGKDPIPARSGRLVFEDLPVPAGVFEERKAWDIKGDASFGMPNPRASTAWYFTQGNNRMRTISLRNGKSFSVWEVLAAKVRGRKFYFHQHPETCHREYKKVNEEMQRALKALPPEKQRGRKLPELIEYKVEAVKPGEVISGGRIDFKDLPKSLLLFLLYALDLNQAPGESPSMAHKLGGLKPFGFGSVALSVTGVQCRETGGFPGELVADEPEGTIPKDIFYPEAFRSLEKILHFPTDANQARDYVFMYPPFNPLGATSEAKGFAVVERAEGGGRGPAPGNSQKLTLFFDHYQANASNCPKVWPGRRK